MRQRTEGAWSRAGVVTAAVGALLALLLPTLGTGDVPAAVTIGALALTVAALARYGVRLVAVLRPAVGVVTTTDHGRVPVLRGRVTDPVHHPLRPRAPGRA